MVTEWENTLQSVEGFRGRTRIPHGGFGTLRQTTKKLLSVYRPNLEHGKDIKEESIKYLDLRFRENISEEITDFKGTDQVPVWYGDKIYYAGQRPMAKYI